jgi:hypothetical protein
MFGFGRPKDHDEVRFRSNHPRGKKWKNVLMSMFATAVVSYNASLIVQGFVTGKIKSLSRSSDSVTLMATEPGWFTFIVLFRLFAVIVFSFAAYATWREARDTL